MSNTHFGWELLYKGVEAALCKKEDVLIAFVHFFLIKRGFRCYGFDKETSQEYGSELLPPNWNFKENLALKYKIGQQNYVLQVTKSEGNIIFNLLNPAKVEASSVVFEVESSVAEVKGTLLNLIPNYSEIWHKLEESLAKPVVPENIGRVSVGVQTSKDDNSQSERVSPTNNPRPYAERNRDPEQYFDPLRVGRSDLDPLGRLGGGMLFQPPRRGGINPGLGVPGGLPRGAVPPGSRFDPFGPPDLNLPRRGGFGGRLSNPDYDHMPPPGFDDMFM